METPEGSIACASIFSIVSQGDHSIACTGNSSMSFEMRAALDTMKVMLAARVALALSQEESINICVLKGNSFGKHLLQLQTRCKATDHQ